MYLIDETRTNRLQAASDAVELDRRDDTVGGGGGGGCCGVSHAATGCDAPRTRPESSGEAKVQKKKRCFFLFVTIYLTPITVLAF